MQSVRVGHNLCMIFFFFLRWLVFCWFNCFYAYNRLYKDLYKKNMHRTKKKVKDKERVSYDLFTTNRSKTCKHAHLVSISFWRPQPWVVLGPIANMDHQHLLFHSIHPGGFHRPVLSQLASSVRHINSTATPCVQALRLKVKIYIY